MGRYSSDSDSSDYSRKKSLRRNRSSSRSSSSSRYSSRSKKSKKARKYRRSRSPERSRYKRRSRDRSSSSRHKKSRHSKHSRRRSRSSSRSKHSSNRSSYSSISSRSKDKRESPSNSKSRRKSRSRSPYYSSRLTDKRSPINDTADLLAKLNKAAVEALSENSKKLESIFPENQESRLSAINEINSENFVQKSFCSNDRKEEAPVVAEVNNFVNFNNQLKEEPGCLLHPNLLIEEQSDKTNRWIKKLYQIRQRSLFGDLLVVD